MPQKGFPVQRSGAAFKEPLIVLCKTFKCFSRLCRTFKGSTLNFLEVPAEGG